jgi:uncharacterized protein YfdQ (DUF2303 family)
MDDQDNNAADDDGGAGFSFAPAMLGGGLSTMAGVGAALTASFEFASQHLHPDIVAVTEPGTELEVHVVVDSDGVKPLPESVFDQYRTSPKHRRGTATLLDLSSFIAHVNRFRSGDTVIFANNDRARPSMTAVLDYHAAGATSTPAFGKHRSAHAFPLSDEWKAWTAKNGQAMKMVDFAQFLEDRIIDVLPTSMVDLNTEAKLFVDTLGGMGKVADPSKLMQLATEFQVLENSVVKSAQNLATGETSIVFESEHLDAAGQKLTVPSMFILGIPVFKGGAPYQVIARLRYRKQGPTITFWYELWRTDRVFDHAFEEATAKVASETSCPVLLGTDEG